MAISNIRTAFALAGAALSLLAGCAGTPAGGDAPVDGQVVAQATCNHDDDRPTTGSSISHHDCKRHSNVVTLDPSNLDMSSRNTGGGAQSGHN
jgi:hypothetical protein